MASLAGCSGDAIDFRNTPQVITFAAVGAGAISANEALSITNELNSLTSPSNTKDVSFDIPSSPTASYNGVVAFDLDPNSSVMGRMTMNANFAANSVSGSAGDFTIFDETGPSQVPLEQMSGVLPITSGTLSTTVTNVGPRTNLAATMNGNLSTAAGIYGVASTLTGTFLDVKGQSVVGGNMDGTLTSPNASSQSIAGRMIAAE